jgi:NADPH-dependent 2,4-dienoyl-CoA reductase/sulfur reductase-like enzyme
VTNVAERLIVIGGNAAGMSAASQARRRRGDLDIVAFERGDFTSYSACGIPYVVSGEVGGLDDLVARSAQEHRARHIDVRLHHEALGIDLSTRRVTVRDHNHQRDLQLGFDHLLMATGSRPRRPDVPGVDLDFVHGVQTLGDAARLLDHARQARSARIVVVGSGYIGLEMAESFLRWGAEVIVLEGGQQVMHTFDPDMAAHIEAAMSSHGVEVRTSVEVQGFEPGRVQTSAGAVPADLVVLGTGVAPNSELGRDAGLPLGARGSLQVDRRQQTPLEGVWAAGDCAQSFHRVSESWVYIALGTVANRHGRVAGINLGGGYATFPGVVGTAVSKICATEVGRTGLNEAEATAAGFRYATTVIESTTRAAYFPGSRPIKVKLVGELGTGRLLGAQIVGEEGAAKRIDVLAAVITAGMDAEQLVDLDLSYAPPFSPLWDPVVVAARELLKEV